MEEEKENIVEEEEILEEEEMVIQDLPDSPITDIPVPDIVEEDVKVQTDGRKFSELSAFEKIKFASAQNGVEVKKPQSSCKKCHGSGVISTRIIKTEVPITSGDTSGTEMISEELPNPCRCIFRKEDLHKMFTGKVPLSKKMERSLFKRTKKPSIKVKLEKKQKAIKNKAKKQMKKKMKKKFNKR